MKKLTGKFVWVVRSLTNSTIYEVFEDDGINSEALIRWVNDFMCGRAIKLLYGARNAKTLRQAKNRLTAMALVATRHEVYSARDGRKS